MGLKGKMVVQMEINVEGDIFHELFRHRPHHISGISPKILSADLHEGDIGTVGCVHQWKYTHGGKEEEIKAVIEAIDETKKQVTLKGIEGDVLKLYPLWCATLHYENDGKTTMLTWTLNYEKVNDDVPEPVFYLEFFIDLSKDIEKHHLK